MVWFPYTNNYHKLFKELQSSETDYEYGGENKMWLFTINYLLHMFYSIRYAQNNKMYYVHFIKIYCVFLSVQRLQTNYSVNFQ